MALKVARVIGRVLVWTFRQLEAHPELAKAIVSALSKAAYPTPAK